MCFHLKFTNISHCAPYLCWNTKQMMLSHWTNENIICRSFLLIFWVYHITAKSSLMCEWINVIVCLVELYEDLCRNGFVDGVGFLRLGRSSFFEKHSFSSKFWKFSRFFPESFKNNFKIFDFQPQKKSTQSALNKTLTTTLNSLKRFPLKDSFITL